MPDASILAEILIKAGSNVRTVISSCDGKQPADLVEGKARQDKTRQDKTGQGKARQDKARQGKIRQDELSPASQPFAEDKTSETKGQDKTTPTRVSEGKAQTRRRQDDNKASDKTKTTHFFHVSTAKGSGVVVLSCLVVSCRVVSCRVVSCLVLSHLVVLSCLVRVSCLVPFFP
jgi:hypothetical protein